jgi:hypothetical protein
MKIKPDDFRVPEGETVDLAKWKTLTNRAYSSVRFPRDRHGMAPKIEP